MSKSKTDSCSYRGCSEQALYILEVDGRRFFICKEHYRLLLKRLRDRATREGAAQLTLQDLFERGRAA